MGISRIKYSKHVDQALLDGLEMFKQALGDQSLGMFGHMYLLASQHGLQFLDEGLDNFFGTC